MSFFTVALLVACGEQNQAPKAIVSDTKSVQSQETNSNLISNRWNHGVKSCQ